MFRVSLSDNLLQTILIPGLVLLIALGFLTVPHWWTPLTSTISDCVDALNTYLRQHDTLHIGTGVLSTGILAVAVVTAYIVAMFLGLLLAVLVGYLELYVLDGWCASLCDFWPGLQ